MGPVRHLFLINPHAGKYDRTQEMREKLRTALALWSTSARGDMDTPPMPTRWALRPGAM